MVLFGHGYCGTGIAAAFADRGADVIVVGRNPPDDVSRHIASADHIVSTVAPGATDDPILARYGSTIAGSRARLLYLSSTGVYGDTGGGWVDESAPARGRRAGRVAADRAWVDLGAAVLRLPGIYGPGRSVIDRLRAGEAQRVDVPEQVFSRIHVEDVVRAVMLAAATDVSGPFNIADDLPCPQAEIVAWAAERLGVTVPPLLTLEAASLSPAARAFYAENRRIANGRARRLLGWRPAYPDYRAGLAPLIDNARNAPASAATSVAGVAQCVTSRTSPAAQS